MMMFWLFLGLLTFVVVLVLLRPFLVARDESPQYLSVIATALGLPALVLAMYFSIGQWQPPEVAVSESVQAQEGRQAEVLAMVESLASRLETDGGNLEEWMMLGKSYTVLGRYEDAAAAFAQARRLSGDENLDVLAHFAEALILADRTQLTGEAATLFEQVLAGRPDDQRGLWYGGLAAFEETRYELAISRWQALLNLAPQEGLRALVQERIEDARSRQTGASDSLDTAAAVTIDVTISADPDLTRNLAPDTTVFVLARDRQPGPPLAVRKISFRNLPIVVSLGDADAMIPSRKLSGSKQIEVIARIAVGGSPVAQPGDFFGAQSLDLVDKNTQVDILINRRVE